MSRHSNNFDALRLAAALAVLVDHSMEIVGDRAFGFGGMAISTMGVKVFFSISGYLIAQSWINDPHAFRFALRRARRIMPALAAVVLACVLVLGPWLTPLSLHAFLLHPLTTRYLGNMVFYISFALPGVFAGNPIANAVNGSLWTLPAEVAMYALTPLLVFLAARGRFWIMLCLALSLIGCMTFFLRHPAPWVVAATDLWTDASLAPYFIAGSAVATLRLERFLDWRIAIAAVIVVHLAVPFAWPWTEAAFCLVLPYATLAIGLRRWPILGDAGRWGDFSYGLYLWAFPIQQTIVAVHGTQGGGWFNVAVAVPATMLMAILSFRLIERPALRWRIGRRGVADPSKVPTGSPPRVLIRSGS